MHLASVSVLKPRVLSDIRRRQIPYLSAWGTVVHGEYVTGTEPQPRHPRISLAVLCASLLMVGMDLTVLHVAVPAVSRQLLPTAAQLVWIVDVYALVVAACLLTFGTLGDRFGRKRILVLGFAVFGSASAGAAVSADPAQLIVARAALGVGGAMIMSSTPAIVRILFPDDRERARAVGLWVASYSVGVSLGPLLSGALLERFWWGAAFLINLPIAGVAVVGGLLLVPESRDPRPHRWDWIGALLSALGLGAVVYALQQVGDGGGAPVPSWVIAVAGLSLLVGFVMRQRRIGNPLLDLSLFTDRRFSVAALCVVGCYGAYAALLFLLTQRLQLIDGYSPLRAGLMLTPLAVANGLGSALAPRSGTLFGRHRGLAAGLLLLALALLSFSVFGSADNYAGLVLAGLGSGAVMTLGSDAMLGSARPECAGAVGAIQETSFSFGAGLGLALFGTILSLVYRLAFPPVPVAAGQDWEVARGSLGAASEAASHNEVQVANALLSAARHAFDAGFSVATAVAAGVLVFLALLALLWLRKRPARPEEPAESFVRNQ